MERWRPAALNVVARLSPLRPVPGLLWRVPGLLWRMPAQAKAGLAGVAVVLMVIGSVLFIRNPAGPFGKIEPLPASTGTLTRIPVLGPGHRFLYFPVSGHVTAGLKYRFVLLTHCGLDYPTGPDFDASFWDAVESTQRNRLANPPSGFAQPEDVGYMILVTPDSAEFHSSAGGVARYTRRTKALIASLCN
jgi:hypothetical protein